MARMSRQHLALLSTTFLFGATSILAQVALLRVFLAVVEENEILLGVFFAVWFLGIFAGAWVGGKRKASGDRLVRGAFTTLVVQAALFPLIVLSVETVRANFHWTASEALGLWPLLAIAFAHLAPFGFLTGMAFPLLCRLREETAAKGGSSLAGVYAWESLGSLVSGAAFT
ncbi:MAG: hypothetical protein NTW86_05220, partial [Candidatus Sumerlaeota bacterium]|nr:hypothetical protein [Candidatus Sumerlaeota bacterium]